MFFQGDAHCIYKEKPKVLSGYFSKNYKVYKLVEFYKHAVGQCCHCPQTTTNWIQNKQIYLKCYLQLTLNLKQRAINWCRCYLVSRIIKKDGLAFSVIAVQFLVFDGDGSRLIIVIFLGIL